MAKKSKPRKKATQGKTINKAGRPSKYKPEYAADEFITQYVNHCKKADELVSLCGLAVYLEVCEDTLQEWKKVHREFSVSLAKINQLSKQEVLNKGLKSKYSPNMAKFVLSACHGMAERTELSGKDGNSIEVNIIDFEKIIIKNESGAE